MGGLSSLLGGGGGSQKTSSSVKIPKWLEPSVKPLYWDSANKAQQLAAQPYQKYTGSRVAGLPQGMLNGINSLNAAPGSSAYSDILNPSAGSNFNASKRLTGDTLAGKYLNGNPYLDDVISKSSKDITSQFQKTAMPQMQANLARKGAFGGSGWDQSNRDMNEDYAGSLSDMISALRYQDYATERGYQDKAIGDAMAGANLGLSAQRQNEDASRGAIDANDIIRQRDQAQIDADYGDFTEERDWLFRALQALQGGIGNVEGLYGSSGKGAGGASGNALGNGIQAAAGIKSLMG